MLILGLDTSTPAVTVAVADVTADAADVRASATHVDARRHGELVAPTVRDVLAQAGAGPRDLQAIGVGLGPGPFTGLRVGIMTAAAMGDSLGIPVYGTCSLDALALAGRGAAGPFAVATDARRREVYWAAYDESGLRTAGPFVDKPADVDWAHGVFGAGAELYADVFGDRLLPGRPAYPEAGWLIERLAPRAVAGEPGDALTPLYLRRPDAVEPRARKHVTA